MHKLFVSKCPRYLVRLNGLPLRSSIRRGDKRVFCSDLPPGKNGTSPNCAVAITSTAAHASIKFFREPWRGVLLAFVLYLVGRQYSTQRLSLVGFHSTLKTAVFLDSHDIPPVGG